MTITVIVAIWPDADGLDRCLDGLSHGNGGADQVVVVGCDPVPDEMKRRFPRVTWNQAPAGATIPVMWGIGMQGARGEVVAITTTQFLPGKDWADGMRKRHDGHTAGGVGGPIRPPRGRHPVSWATYFLRYSQYFHLRTLGEVDDIAGDNASYKRVALEAHRDVIRDGFWEPEFHRAVLAGGGTLLFDPAIELQLRDDAPFRQFCRQRFRHGRHFGQERIARSAGQRFLRLATSPLVPPVLLLKIFRRVFLTHHHVGAFLGSLPVLLVFIFCWSLGEFLGYARPFPPGPPSPTTSSS